MQKLYNLKHIETPRLIIRPVELGDEIPLNQSIHRSLAILKKWMPWADDPSLETTQDFIQQGVFRRISQLLSDFPVVVIHKADQKIIGASGYNERSDFKAGIYEIGYWCDLDYQGKGYVTEFVNALTRYALDALLATQVVIKTETKNLTSIAVAKRLNFENEGACVSVTKDNATDFCFTCKKSSNLPDLVFSWSFVEENPSDLKIIHWAKEILKIKDDTAFALSKAIVKTPWSTVLEINTGSQIVYLKKTPPMFYLEPTIIRFFEKRFNANVPNIIAQNDDLNCFLMTSEGKTLRERLKHHFEEALLFKTIEQFTLLQINIADHVDSLLAMGIPDYRLEKLPGLYTHLVQQKDLLASEGLSELTIQQLEAMTTAVSYLCNKLSCYPIKQTFIQPDFNDNNTLVDDTKKITMIDLGEIVISHPFFSLLNFLQQMKKHHGLKETDDLYIRLKDTCFKNYKRPFINEKDFQDALALAEKVNIICGLVYQDRFMKACGKENLIKHQHWKLKNLIETFMSSIGQSFTA